MRRRSVPLRSSLAVPVVAMAVACGAPSQEAASAPTAAASVPAPNPSGTSPTPVPSEPATAPAAPPTSPVPTSTASPAATAAPRWLGQRELPRRADGFGAVLPTPPELVDRRIATVDLLPPPPGARFRSSARPVPGDVLERSTWSPACPVQPEDLRYVQVSFWGFDDRPHTGELLVAAEVADDLVGVFEALYDARFPIEEMRVIAAEELDLPPTGDGNTTTGFVCRPARGQTSWSQHALGLAVDVNPFHNPYVRGDLVLPELASSYTDRTDVRPGMVVAGDVVTTAFARIGWGWGGSWTSLTDPMHFSADGT